MKELSDIDSVTLREQDLFFHREHKGYQTSVIGKTAKRLRIKTKWCKTKC